MVTDAAAREGISLDQYIREASLMRMAWELSMQRALSEDPSLADLAAAVRELTRELKRERERR